MKSRNCLVVCAAVLLLAGCSDDDSKSDDSLDPSVGESGETSELAPGGDDVPENPPSSTPGGDTTAIAGLWDARQVVDGQTDERYVEISPNGLYTEYDYRQDDVASDGNCYVGYGPITLTPEDAATNTYGLSDDRFFSASSDEANNILSIAFGEDPVQQWSAVTGISTADFPGCADIQE